MTLSRRRLLVSAAVAAVGAVSMRSRAAAAPKAQVSELRTISDQPALYHGWPTLARCRSGRLLLTYSGGREGHICPFGRVEMMQSDDDGRTWSFPRVVLDGAIDDRDSGVVETSKGSILVTTFTSLAYQPSLVRAMKAAAGSAGAWPEAKLRRWKGVHNRLSAEQRKAELGEWMIRSTDGGITWSARYATIVNSPHGPIQLSDGRLLYAGKELWTNEQRNGVCESTDDGQTWRWVSAIPTREGDDPREYHELHAVEAGDGRLIVQIRNQNKANDRETLQCESTDGGKTWSTPRAIGVWGLPSHLLRLKDGRLLMTYGYRRKPFGNQARISADQGRTWSDPMTVSDDGMGGDLGYPSTVELADGSLLTVWYELLKGSSCAALRQARWAIAQ